MKQFAFLLPLILLVSSASAIQVDWRHNYDGDTYDNLIEDESTDEFLVGGVHTPSVSAVDLQVASDSAERVANGVFDLYRLLSSDNKRLNQIVSNVKQTVGKDTFEVNHVFKHIKNGNYYLEVDTDKYNFAVTIVRLPRNEHSNHNAPSSSSKPVQTTAPVHHPHSTQTPRPTTTASVKTTQEATTARPTTAAPESTTARPTTASIKTTPESTTTETPRTTTASAESAKPTTAAPVETPKPASTTESPKSTTTASVESPKPASTTDTPRPTTAAPHESPKPASTAAPIETPKPTTPQQTPSQKPPAAIHPEDEYLRRLEDKRFRQILGQWYLVGVPRNEYSDVYNYRACEIITIYTHGPNYFFKDMNNIGNSTYEMKDTPMTSVDKKNSLFKMNNSVYAYKMVLLEGKNYKVKLFQLTDINNPSSVHFYTERLVDEGLLTKVFNEHYAGLNINAVNQYCYSD